MLHFESYKALNLYEYLTKDLEEDYWLHAPQILLIRSILLQAQRFVGFKVEHFNLFGISCQWAVPEPGGRLAVLMDLSQHTVIRAFDDAFQGGNRFCINK